MELQFDESEVRERLLTITCDEANIGGDEGDQLLGDLFADGFDPLHEPPADEGGTLEDVLRIIVALQPFLPRWRFHFWFSSDDIDKRVTHVALVLSPARSERDTNYLVYPNGICAGLQIGAMTNFGPLDMADSVVHVLSRSCEVLRPALTNIVSELERP